VRDEVLELAGGIFSAEVANPPSGVFSNGTAVVLSLLSFPSGRFCRIAFYNADACRIAKDEAENVIPPSVSAGHFWCLIFDGWTH
jgi:hypothetical protein